MPKVAATAVWRCGGILPEQQVARLSWVKVNWVTFAKAVE
jgi:hypothetical protein